MKMPRWMTATWVAAALATTALGSQAAGRTCSYTVTSSIIYGTGLLEQGLQLPLLMDAYLPTTCNDGAAGVVPPLILIPGGGFNWVQRDRPKIVEIADGFARAGFAVFSIEHRINDWNGYAPVSESKTPAELKAYQPLLKKSPYPGDQHLSALIAMEDGFKARDYIAAHAASFNIDMSRLGLVGGSSGSFTALGMEYSGDDLNVGILDARALVDMWGDFYPHTHMKNGDSPLLILAGTEDPVVDYALTTDTMKRAKAVQVDASRISLPGVKHGLDDANIFTRKIQGTNMTVFEGMVAFTESKLTPERGIVWPPAGQTREMWAEPDPAPTKASGKVKRAR